MSANAGTVYVVDDDVAMRDSLGLLLGLKGFRTQMFANAENVLKAYSGDWFGCMLIDVRMPGMSGLELQAELRTRGCTVPIIIVTAYGDVHTAREALKGGAADFLEKPVDETVLCELVEAAMKLNRAQQLLVQQARGLERATELTGREKQVMDLLAAGFAVKQIAERLEISPRTVEVYKARLMQKLHARDLAAGGQSRNGKAQDE